MRKAIIAADLHIQKKPGMWAGRSEVSGDDIFGLQQVADLAKEHDADLYLLGDVLDSVTNLPRPMVAVQQILGDLAKKDRVFFLQGQHELVVGSAYQNQPWLSLLPGANHIGGQEFTFMGFKTYGLDYFASAFESLEFAKVPKDVQCLMMHGTIDTAFPLGFHFTADILKHFPDLRFVFAGDFHEAIMVLAGKVPVMYTGSTWQLSSNEPRDKSVILVEQTGKKTETTRLPLKTRKIVKLSECYNEEGNLDFELLPKPDESLPKELQMPVILIDLPTDGPTMERLAQGAHLYSTSAANPDTPTRELIDQANKLTNAEILANYADREKQPEQFAFTLDVIENPVGDAVQRLKNKLGIKDPDCVIQMGPVTTELTVNVNEDNPEEEEEVLT